MNHTDKEEITTEEIDMAVKNLPKTTTSGWEERFQEQFGGPIKGWRDAITTFPEITQFIRTEIEAAEERGKATNEAYQKERTYGEDAALVSEGYEAGRRDVLEELKGKLPKEEFVTDCLHGPNDSCDTDCTYQGRAISRNEYRKEILNIIKSIKGE